MQIVNFEQTRCVTNPESDKKRQLYYGETTSAFYYCSCSIVVI